MKKTLFAMVVAAMAFAVNANAQFSVGAGYANETIISKIASVLDEDYKGYAWEKNRLQLNGFYVEAAYDWKFASVGPGDFVLQPGVRYYFLTENPNLAKINLKYKDNKQKANQKECFSNHLLDIPVNVKYSYDFVPGTLKAYVFAGPTFSFGLAAINLTKKMAYLKTDEETINYTDIVRVNYYTGKYYTKEYQSEEDDYTIEKGKDDENKLYDMFDLKLALGLGVTLSEKVDVKFGYNIGLLNRSHTKNTEDYKYSMHSNIMYFGVTYKF